MDVRGGRREPDPDLVGPVSGLYPQGAFTATEAELAAMHEADAAMRVDNLARWLIDNHPETPEGRQARQIFLGKLKDDARKEVEAAARVYWQATRKSRAPAKASA